MRNKILKQFSLQYPCLTRDFIHDRLFESQNGYFNQNNLQINELKEPIDFKNIEEIEDYSREITLKYPQFAWITPSELFKPWYGMSVANYIHQTQKKMDKPLKIIEVGAGTGSAADSILSFFRKYDKNMYNSLTYEIIELSKIMTIKAKQKLQKNHSKLLKNGQIRIIQDDIANWRSQNKNDHYFFLFLEVLENMPHDKIMKSNNKWDLQTMIDYKQGIYLEKQQPISDNIINEVLQIYENLYEIDPFFKKEKNFVQKIFNVFYQKSYQDRSLYLPTHLYKTFKNINRNIPNHHMIIADFDTLGSKIEGINAPIITKKLKNNNLKTDYHNYLVDRGDADIVFPTNFKLLSYMYKKTCGRDGQQIKSFEFVEQYLKEDWDFKKSGYNPLKEDFQNSQFFITDI